MQTFNRAGRHKDLSSFRLQDSHCKVPCVCEMTSRTTVPGRSSFAYYFARVRANLDSVFGCQKLKLQISLAFSCRIVLCLNTTKSGSLLTHSTDSADRTNHDSTHWTLKIWILDLTCAECGKEREHENLEAKSTLELGSKVNFPYL